MPDILQTFVALVVIAIGLVLLGNTIAGVFRTAHQGDAPEATIVDVHKWQIRTGARCACGHYIGHDGPGHPRQCIRCSAAEAAALVPEPPTDAVERGLQCRRCRGALQPLAHPCDCEECRQAVDNLLKRLAELAP